VVNRNVLIRQNVTNKVNLRVIIIFAAVLLVLFVLVSITLTLPHSAENCNFQPTSKNAPNSIAGNLILRNPPVVNNNNKFSRGQNRRVYKG